MSTNGGAASSSRFSQRVGLPAIMALCLLVCIAFAMMLNACGGGASSNGSTSHPTQPGNPSVSAGNVISCTSDFYSDATIPAVCQTATVQNCPSAANLNVTYSYDAPASPKGTIVFLSGGAGTVDAGDVNAASYYFSQGYEVIQVEWSDDWELTTIPSEYGGSDTTTYTANIQLAACRNATLLNYIFNGGNTNLYNGGGRCAQGSSAGSAAIAYSLTFYGAGSYLDAVELISGPPLANIEQGCVVPTAPELTVCPAGQFGCKLGDSSPWVLGPQYTGAKSGVQSWTGDPTCAAGVTTSSSSNQAWLEQSIVNDGTNNPVYSYPNTSMTAWLCQSVEDSNLCVGGTNTGQGGSPQDYCPNNSTSQAQFYYAKLTGDPSNLPAAPFNVYAVQNCNGPEGVTSTSTNVPALNNIDGQTAVEQDMMNRCVKQ
jgi:hypothetical protein